MTRGEKIAVSILKPINPTIVIVLGVYTVVWGLWLANPFWTVFTTASLYSAMMEISVLHISPELFWGGIAIASGMLIMRGAMKPSYKNLKIGAITGFFHWLTIGLLYFAGDWMNTGGITALTFAIYSAILWLNLKVNKRHYN